MSTVRPTLRLCGPDEPALSYRASYMRVLQAVRVRRSLIRGRLDDGRNTCAVGAFFRQSPTIGLNRRAIDEITAYNDSFPALTPHQRWRRVIEWLRTVTARL